MSDEPRFPGLRRFLRLVTSERSVRRQVDEEIGFHLDSRIAELVAGGMAAEAARMQAVQEYGDVAESRRELSAVDRRRFHRNRRAAWWDALGQDLRYGLRGIRRSPGFAALVVITLTLGIGANATMFGIVDRLLLRPPAHVAEPEGVVRIYFRERHRFLPGQEWSTSAVTTYSAIAALRQHVQGFSDVSAFYRGTYSTGTGAEAREVKVSLVDGNFFRVLGVQPVLGRFFTMGEDRDQVSERVVVLSHGFWRRHFGGAPDVLGLTIPIEREQFTIVGVAPRGFSGVDLENVDAWVPISTLAAAGFGDDWRTAPNAWWVRAIGRHAPGATREQVEAQATGAYRAIVRQWNQPWRDSLGTVVTGSVIAARGPEGTPTEARVSLWLLGVAGVVLLIACANIANLLIARALRRRREIAVRLALGVGRGRLLRQLMTEALLLATVAAGVALLLTHWGAQAIQSVIFPGYVWGESPVDGRVLAFTGAATFITAILAGLAPALQAARTDVTGALKAGAREGGGRRMPLRTALLVAQTALSVVLLVGAGLFVHSLHNVRSTDVGIDLDRVLLVRSDLGRAGFDTARVRAIYQSAEERARLLPGIERATIVAASVPMRMGSATSIHVPGRDSLPRLPGGGPYYSAVGHEYLATLGARVVRGRGFGEADQRAGARVLLVNELVARYYWPNEDAIGQCVRVGSDEGCSEVVGIVQDVILFTMLDEERGQLYVPITHPVAAGQRPSALLVRTTPGARGVESMLRREIHGIAPGMPYVNVQSFAELVAPQMAPWRLGATMCTIFGILALVIAAVGLYSVVSYVTSQRTHELGVRMALGARRSDVVRLVVLGELRVVAIGLAVGIGVALFAGRWVESLLRDVSPRDPGIYVAVSLVLVSAALLASLVPAFRASRVDPAMALRAE